MIFNYRIFITTMSKLFLPIFLFGSLGCSQSTDIESSDAISLLKNNEYYFLDVRTIKEHKEKSIPGTYCIPLQVIEQRIQEIDQYRGKNIIVYCRSGNRSGAATKILNANGFKAYNLVGGMNEWNGPVITH